MPIPSNCPQNDAFFNQKEHDAFVQRLAKNPGRHSDNVNRQNVSYALTYYISRVTPYHQSLTAGIHQAPRSDACVPHETPLTCALQDAPLGSTITRVSGQNCQQGERRFNKSSSPDLSQLTRNVFQACNNLTRLQQTEAPLQAPPAVSLYPGPSLSAIAETIGNGMASLLSHTGGILSQAGNLINRHDPLKMLMAEAAVLPTPVKSWKRQDTQSFVSTTAGQYPESEIEHDNARPSRTQYVNFIKSGREALAQNDNKYHNKFPCLKDIAATLLREKIKQRFHLDINPDETYFVHFNAQGNNAGEITFFEPLAKKTLTQCLFTNFDSDFWAYYVREDAVCAIYDASYLEHHSDKFDFADRINIDATKFADLVWSIDFYRYAKEKLVERYSHKDEHIKHLFIKFMHHLDISQLDNESAKDILSAVGLTENYNVTPTLFDINGYTAANAFVFKNRHSGRVTLYLPKSKTKLISFRDDFEMRRWVVNACGTQAGRSEIASHFTFANRQDGLFYSGIDAWLNTLNNDSSYHDRIMTVSVPVSSTLFFAELLKGITDKALSDLKLQVKSDARVSLQLWEEAIDASNIIPNPISPFASFAMHIGHMISAVTYKEKMQEWSNIKNDAVNIVIMVVLDVSIKLPDSEGYKFIHGITNSLSDTSEIERIFTESDFLHEENNVNHPQLQGGNWFFDKDYAANPAWQDHISIIGESQHFDPQPGLDWMLEENSYIPPRPLDEDPAPDAAASNIIMEESNVIPHMRPAENAESLINKLNHQFTYFIPMRKTPTALNIDELNQSIRDISSRILKENDFDIYYGLKNSAADTPDYIKNARFSTRRYLNSAKRQITRAYLKSTNKNALPGIKEHLSIALGTTDGNILSEAAATLKKQLLNAFHYVTESAEIDYANVGFISTEQTVNPNNELLFKSKITDLNYLTKMPLGFTITSDPFKRIFILLDSSPEISPEGKNFLHPTLNLIDSVYIHEVSHATSYTADFCYNSNFERINNPDNPRVLLQHFNKGINIENFSRNQYIHDFILDIYKHFGITTPYDATTALNIVKHIPILRANMQMENADNFVNNVKFLSAPPDNLRVRKSINSKEDPIKNLYITLIFTAARNNFSNAI